MPKRRLDIRNIKKKIETGEKLFKYEEDYLWKKLRDRADYLAQAYPKLLAYVVDGQLIEKKKVKCLTCPDMITYSQANGCHWLEKGSHGAYWCRREERNIYNCCEKCNAFKKEMHHTALTAHVTKIYGLDRVEEKIAQYHKVNKRPKRREIQTVVDTYTDKIKKLCPDFI